jgi:subtilisin family serine protease
MKLINKKITVLILIGTVIIPQNFQAAAGVSKSPTKISNTTSIALKDKSELNNEKAYKTPQKNKFVSNEVIVKYKKDINKTIAKNEIVKKNSLRVKKSIGSQNIDLLTISCGSTVEETISKLKGNEAIEFVQPNYIYQDENFTLDSREGELWGLENFGQTIENQTGVTDVDIDIKDAWNITQGSSNVVVGVIDSGIDINHPELKNNIWVNTGEIPNNNIDDDRNGYIDDVNGWDFYNNDNTVFDEKDSDKHGTHVAGIIGASLNNSGIVGVSPKVKIMPLKFIGPYGGDTIAAIKAIQYAKNKGVKLLNASWGGGDYDQALKDAVDSSNSLFIVAAGNEDNNNDINKMYPASFDSSNILSVAAVDNQGYVADFSNYGMNSVHVAAPGVNILSTVPRRANLGAAVGSKNGISKTMVQGFDLYYVDEAKQQDMVKRTADYLELSLEDQILVISDDEMNFNIGGYNAADRYCYYLDQLAYNNVWTYKIDYMESGLSLDDLSQFKAVFWILGDAWQYTLSNYGQQNLQDYLTGGGSVFLSGNFISYENYMSDFFKTYFHINFLHNDYGKTTLIGNSQSIFDGQTYEIQDIPSDFIEPSDSAGEVLLYYQGKEDYSNLYAYESGTSMSAPYVSGIAALLMSKDVTNPLILKSKLMEGTTKLDSLYSFVSTSGLVNAYNSLTLLKDLNGDSSVSMQDLALLGKNYNITANSSSYNNMYDFNGDKSIDLFDLVILSRDLNN